MSERSRKVTNFLWKWWNLTNKWNKYFSFLPLKKRLASSGRQVCFSFRRYWRFFKAEPQRREYLFSYTEETRGNGKLSTLSGHYAPSRSIFSTRGPKTRDSLSAWSERASEQGSTERFIGSERRKNVEEVVTLAENCDCPVKLRVLYSLYFLRTVSSSLLPPSLVWFPSPSPPSLFFFILVACWNLRAPPLPDNNVGVTRCGGGTPRGPDARRRGNLFERFTRTGPTTPLIQSEFTSIKLPPAPILITVRSN